MDRHYTSVEIRSLLRDAWDDGYESSWADHDEYHSSGTPTPNPYDDVQSPPLAPSSIAAGIAAAHAIGIAMRQS